MENSIIEGKRARKYESMIKDTHQAKLFDRFILDNVKQGKSVKVCDFACGPGNDIGLLRGKVGEIVGVDLSSEMIKICEEKFAKDDSVKLRLASVTDTNLEPGSFDYVIIRMGIHHVKDKDNVMAEAHRLLKPKGRLIIIDKFYLSIWELYSKALSKLVFHGNPAIFREYLVSRKRYDKIFAASSFRTLKYNLVPYDKKHTGQSFMCVFEKK